MLRRRDPNGARGRCVYGWGLTGKTRAPIAGPRGFPSGQKGGGPSSFSGGGGREANSTSSTGRSRGCERGLRRLGAEQPLPALLMRVAGIGFVLAYAVAAKIGELECFPSRPSWPATAASAHASNQSDASDRRGPFSEQAHATCAGRWARPRPRPAPPHPPRERYERTKRRLGKQRGPKLISWRARRARERARAGRRRGRRTGRSRAPPARVRDDVRERVDVVEVRAARPVRSRGTRRRRAPSRPRRRSVSRPRPAPRAGRTRSIGSPRPETPSAIPGSSQRIVCGGAWGTLWGAVWGVV
jgi:hypothetical protein